MEIKYGTSALELPLEALPNVHIAQPPLPQLPAAAIPESLFGELSGLISHKRPRGAVILVEDHTRHNPEYPALIRRIRNQLCSAGVGELSLVIAYGTHAPMTDQQAASLYGPDNTAALPVVHHDCRSSEQLVTVGRLSDGAPLRINKAVHQVEFRICIGSVMPHLFAGFTGGRKIVLPGICAYENIKDNHAMVLDPRADLGRLEDNPLHRHMAQAATLVEIDFSIQLCRNTAGHLASVHWGTLDASFEQAAAACRACSTITLPGRFDLVIVGCGGSPSDTSIYLSQRPFSIASRLVKTTGQAVVIGSFSSGLGNQLFEQWFSDPVARSRLADLTPHQIEIGIHSAYLLHRSIVGKKMWLYSTMPESMATSIGLTAVKSAGEIMTLCKNSGQVCVIADAARLIVETNESMQQAETL